MDQTTQDLQENWNEQVETFEDLTLSKDLLRGIFSYGFERPSAIQQKAIKPIIIGKDVLAQAQSGTGKTGTFTIGALQRIDPNQRKTQVIILAPVRELAKQIYDVVKGIGQYLNIEAFCCIGGIVISILKHEFYIQNQICFKNDVFNTSTQETREKCKQGVHIIIATPGRLIDMMKNKYLDATFMKLLVVDEADQMLDQGFSDNFAEILKMVPGDIQIVYIKYVFKFFNMIHQRDQQIIYFFQKINKDIHFISVALFSATFPQEIIELSKQFLREGTAKILVKKEQLTLEGIRQYYIAIQQEDQKFRVLVELYKNLTVSQSILFCNSKKTVDDLYDKLTAEGFTVSKIHSQMEQKEREQVMQEFKKGAARILVSTDLMGRGIDVQQLSLVINYEFPRLKEQYIHRVGRAGRYGRKGVAINMVQLELLSNYYQIYDIILTIFNQLELCKYIKRISNILSVAQQEANLLLEVEKYYNTKIDEMPKDLAEVEKELS